MRMRFSPARHRRENGAALVVALIAILLLTALGLALTIQSMSELDIAGNETFANKAFYAADSGIQWGAAQIKANASFVGPTGGGVLTVPVNSPNMNAISVTVPRPALITFANCVGCGQGWYEMFYELTSQAALTNPNNNQDFARKVVIADVSVQPLQGNIGP